GRRADGPGPSRSAWSRSNGAGHTPRGTYPTIYAREIVRWALTEVTNVSEPASTPLDQAANSLCYDPLDSDPCRAGVHAGPHGPAGRTNARGARRPCGAPGPRAVRDVLPRCR